MDIHVYFWLASHVGGSDPPPSSAWCCSTSIDFRSPFSAADSSSRGGRGSRATNQGSEQGTLIFLFISPHLQVFLPEITILCTSLLAGFHLFLANALNTHGQDTGPWRHPPNLKHLGLLGGTNKEAVPAAGEGESTAAASAAHCIIIT